MDSDSSSGSEASDNSVDPAHAAIAASLVLLLAAAIQVTKTLRALRNRRQPETLENLVLKAIDRERLSFIKKKNHFSKMPAPLLEKICRECSGLHRPRLARALMNPQTRHLCINANKPFSYANVPKAERWRQRDLERLCEDVVREGETSLLSLNIWNDNEPSTQPALCPGLHSAQVASMLLGLRALTSLKLSGCDSFDTYEMDLLVSILAVTNPGIRSLQLPHLSNKSLRTIANRWPQLEVLWCYRHKFDSRQLAAVMPKLKNLRNLSIDEETLSSAMWYVARDHDPASPPYKLVGDYSTLRSGQHGSEDDMINLFTAFPTLRYLSIWESHIPAVCAGLEGRENVSIPRVHVKSTTANPRALEPLLARLGQQLEVVSCSDEAFSENRVDLNMIGHHCPNLTELRIHAGELVSGDEFVVTEAHFSKLVICELNHMSTHLPHAALPPELVCSLMSSPTLSEFYSRGVSITEQVVAALVQESGEHGALSSLYLLSVWYEPSLNVRVLAEIASHAPGLKFIDLAAVGDEEEKEEQGEDDEGMLEMKGVLTSFMQQSELDVTVDFNYYPA